LSEAEGFKYRGMLVHPCILEQDDLQIGNEEECPLVFGKRWLIVPAGVRVILQPDVSLLGLDTHQEWSSARELAEQLARKHNGKVNFSED